MKSAVQVLTEARELLSDESKWTQNVSARRGGGTPTIVEDPEAVCFCSLGAIDKVKDNFSAHHSAKRYLMVAMKDNVAYFNDAPNRKHSEILEAFDKAIKLAKEGEKV